jgi:hypothetical protein
MVEEKYKCLQKLSDKYSVEWKVIAQLTIDIINIKSKGTDKKLLLKLQKDLNEVVYYGERICDGKTKAGKSCTNGAYYIYQGHYRCGVHSKKDKRKKLPPDPKAKEKRKKLLEERQESVEKVAQENRVQGIKGYVILRKLRMMKEPEHVDGYLKVFPNFKHQNREDGFGCMSLSPKSMGPIDSGQPGLPISLNLENLHQGNKVFPSEVDKDGNPLPRFYKTQKEMYLDPVPHRHKKEAVGKNKNIPVYSLWIKKDGTELPLTYFESRQFYTHFYERIAKDLDDFKELKRLIDQGYNLEIVGYDAYPVAKDKKLSQKKLVKVLDKCYKDTSRPFGHELVLYSMLMIEDEKKYPWRKYKTEEF